MNTTHMNMIYNIDTLQFSKRMQKVGLKPEVADELAEALQEVNLQSIENLTTKADLSIATTELRSEIKTVKPDLKAEIQEVRNELKAEIQEVRIQLKAEIQEVRTELKAVESDLRTAIELSKKDVIIKLGSLMAIGVTILAALIKL